VAAAGKGRLVNARLCKCIVMLTPLLAAGEARASGEALSLLQALQHAARSNPELRKERIAVEISQAQVMASRGEFDLALGITGSMAHNPESTTSNTDGLPPRALQFGASLSRKLETGGALAAQLTGVRALGQASESCQSTSGAVPCRTALSRLSLSFTHPLLQGLGLEVAQANLRRQDALRDLAQLNRQMRTANVLRDIVIAYWQLSYWTRDLEIRRSAVQLAQEQLRITQVQIDAGRLSKLDAAAVERAIGERRQDVLLSEQQLLLRTLELRRLLGISSQASVRYFVATDVPKAAPAVTDAGPEIQKALDNNPQVKALREGRRLTQLEIAVARSTLLPRLDVTGEVSSTGDRGPLKETLKDAVQFDSVGWQAGFVFQMPVPNRLARGNRHAVELADESLLTDIEALSLEIRNQALAAISQMRTAKERLELAEATVGFATQNLDGEKLRFQAGRATNNDVILRQQELKSAEIQVVRATVDLLSGEAILTALTAEILRRYGVTLKG
jgi:outer membrane protein TolC